MLYERMRKPIECGV
jgi:hypothetical protein